MEKLTNAEWQVLNALWAGHTALGNIVDFLYPRTKWSRNTVHTYLTRMEKKGLVNIDRSADYHRYTPRVTREDCSRQERDILLNKVYGGAVGDLIAAFLKESRISAEEKAQLNKILDDMEV
ncbi:MAG: BlaI/MecI/CopY family transcriptional regulator [Oscillospiraceae bacterium]|nr:BlaI/MecI/CopY family transcriptional regulator [Oscillospiraceae bacterium]